MISPPCSHHLSEIIPLACEGARRMCCCGSCSSLAQHWGGATYTPGGRERWPCGARAGGVGVCRKGVELERLSFVCSAASCRGVMRWLWPRAEQGRNGLVGWTCAQSELFIERSCCNRSHMNSRLFVLLPKHALPWPQFMKRLSSRRLSSFVCLRKLRPRVSRFMNPPSS